MKVTLSKYYVVESNEETMAHHMLQTGPLSVCLAASTWSSYKSGILSKCATDVDHCVQAVGVNLDEEYWIVRNSWGTDWGVDGYIYLKYVRLTHQPMNAC
jgi:C1A family cysteine protease